MKISPKKDIPVIVLTGGPCGGKTTMLALIPQYLGNLGYKVFLVPEAATALINGGITPWELKSFPEHILSQMISNEERWIAAAKEHPAEKKVLVADRGGPEGIAYIGSEAFKKVLRKKGYSLTEIRDGRYDAVAFLRTAALGAEDFYTVENNSARKETAAEARVLDQRTLDAWTGHPHLRVIENGPGGFEEKKRNTLAVICGVLGIPEPLEIERKFLISPPDLARFPVSIVEIDIVQYYLKGSGRIRARGQFGAYTYYLTIKRELRPGVRVELERRISQQEFLKLSQQIDLKNFSPVSKKRHCFIWDGQYFELDAITSPRKLYLLELELGNENEEPRLPPFVHVIQDVTEEKQYSNREIARIKRSR